MPPPTLVAERLGYNSVIARSRLWEISRKWIMRSLLIAVALYPVTLLGGVWDWLHGRKPVLLRIRLQRLFEALEGEAIRGGGR